MKYDNDVFELLTTVWVYWKDKSKSNLETSLNLSRRICIFLVEHTLNERVCVCIRLSSTYCKYAFNVSDLFGIHLPANRTS